MLSLRYYYVDMVVYELNFVGVTFDFNELFKFSNTIFYEDMDN